MIDSDVMYVRNEPVEVSSGIDYSNQTKVTLSNQRVSATESVWVVDVVP